MRANRNSIDLVVVEKKWLEKEGLFFQNRLVLRQIHPRRSLGELRARYPFGFSSQPPESGWGTRDKLIAALR